MRSRPLAACALLLAGVLFSPVSRAGPVHPTPQEVTVDGAALALPIDVSIVASRDTARTQHLVATLEVALDAAGFGLVEAPGATSVILHLDGDALPDGGALPAGTEPFRAIGEQGYALAVEPAETDGLRIVVTAAAPHGLFNGAMTLLQLLLDADGAREETLAPQRIRDYPDHRLRGGYLYSVALPLVDGTYVVTDEVRARVDELARMKVNLLLQTQASLTLTESSWAASRDALAELTDHCADRFIELVPAVGSLRNSSLVEHRDGWWVRREPFHFASVASPVLNNGGFELDESCSGAPDGWWVATIPSGGAWTRDTAIAVEGAASMRLDLTAEEVDPAAPSSTNKLTVSQKVGAPGVGSWAAVAQVRTEELAGKKLQLTLYGKDAAGEIVTEVVSALSGLGTQGWTQLVAGPLEVGPEVTELGLYSRVQEAGVGTAWLDDVRILPMAQQEDGTLEVDWAWQPSLEAAVAVEPPVELLTNGSLDVDADGDGVPDGWTLVDPEDPSAQWTRDTTVRRCGPASMRLDVPDLPATADASSNGVSLRQAIDDIAPGLYVVTAWMKLDGVVGADPQLTAYTLVDGEVDLVQSAVPKDGTADWKRIGTTLRVTKPADSLVVYSRLVEPGSGTIWLDQVSVRRVDGSLRNVLRTSYDVRVESADASDLYEPGVDYEVLPGPLSNVFDVGQAPTRVRRLPDGGIAADADVLLSYDLNLAWSTEKASNQSYNLCTDILLDEVYAPALDRVIGELGARSINLNSDEIRGMNRSGACHDAEGALLEDNAERLAATVNAVAARARERDPDVAIYLWDDMFAPTHNGGVETYQVPYGGYPGRTDRTVSEGLLDTGLRMLVWWYGADQWLQQMNGATRFFAEHGHELLVSPHFDATNIADWAAISVATPGSLGVLVTPWQSEEGVPIAADLFWRSPWEQVFFADFEVDGPDALAAAGFELTGDAWWSDDGTCAAGRVYPPGRNTGGLCVGAGGGSVVTPWIAGPDPASWRFAGLARAEASAAAELRVEWDTPLGPRAEAQTVALELGGGDDFVRSMVDVAPPGSVGPVTGARFALTVAPGSGEVAVDNLMARVTRPGCPDGEVGAVVPDVVAPDPAVAASPVTVEIPVCNEGCRTLILDAVEATPAGALQLAPATPLYVSPGACTTLQASGAAGPEPGDERTVTLTLHTNDALGSPVVTQVVLRTEPATAAPSPRGCRGTGAPTAPLALWLALALALATWRRGSSTASRPSCRSRPR